MSDQQTERQYIDNLKREYLDACTTRDETGCFMWGNLFDPTPEKVSRHRRLLKQAGLELGIDWEQPTIIRGCRSA